MALLNLFVLLLLSVSCNFNFSPSEEARTPFSFTSALKLNDYGFASADSTTLNSLVVDDQNNIYVLGYFKGELAGVQSQDIDSFLLKISPTGK